MKVNKYIKEEITAEEESAYITYQIIENELNRIQGGLPNNYNGIVDELQNIRLLITKIGELVLHEENDAIQKRKDIINKGKEHEIDDVFESTSQSLKFRQSTYNSLFFSIHILLEKSFVQIAELIKQFSLNTNSEFPNIRSDIKSFYNYINANISDTDKQDSKSEIFPNQYVYTEIRNALYHRNGFSNDLKLLSWIEDRNDIKITENKLVEIESKDHAKEIKTTLEYHKIKITNSSLLISYIDSIANYFKIFFVMIRNRYNEAYKNGELEM
ncbi:MAG TPA: hypothetical protein PLK15_01375 [Chitinophagales bacterium]|jgi:hypothetical protein|nr:hypothetical protein [Chitinophagales bacterium]